MYEPRARADKPLVQARGKVFSTRFKLYCKVELIPRVPNFRTCFTPQCRSYVGRVHPDISGTKNVRAKHRTSRMDGRTCYEIVCSQDLYFEGKETLFSAATFFSAATSFGPTSIRIVPSLIF